MIHVRATGRRTGFELAVNFRDSESEERRVIDHVEATHCEDFAQFYRVRHNATLSIRSQRDPFFGAFPRIPDDEDTRNAVLVVRNTDVLPHTVSGGIRARHHVGNDINDTWADFGECSLDLDRVTSDVFALHVTSSLEVFLTI